jgi:hypothetical protein
MPLQEKQIGWSPHGKLTRGTRGSAGLRRVAREDGGHAMKLLEFIKVVEYNNSDIFAFCETADKIGLAVRLVMDLQSPRIEEDIEYV